MTATLITRGKSKEITKRVITFMRKAIASGQVESEAAFADIAGATRGHLSNIINDASQARYFTLDQLHSIAKHFNLDMNWVFFGEGTPQRAGKKMKAVALLKAAVAAVELELQTR